MRWLDLISRFLYGMSPEDAARMFSRGRDEPPCKADYEPVKAPNPPQEDAYTWG